MCSILSKESGILFPALIAVYDYINEKKVHVKQLGVYCLVSVLYFIGMSFALGETGSLNYIKFSLESIIQFIGFTAGYIKLFIIPWPFEYFLAIPDGGAIKTWIIIFALPVLGMMFFWSLKDRISLFSLFWICITILPPVTLAFRLNPLFASRYLYLPSIGFVMMISSVTARYESYKKTIILSVLPIVLIFSILTYRATSNYKNDYTFYSMAIRTTPHYLGGYMGKALYYERNGQIKSALNILKNSLPYLTEIDRTFVYGKIALWYGEEGHSDKSIYYYQKFLELNPESSSALTGLGNNLFGKQDYRRALQYYKDAILKDGKNYEALYNLALTYQKLKLMGKAVHHYKIFINVAPRNKYAKALKRAQEIVTKYSGSVNEIN